MHDVIDVGVPLVAIFAGVLLNRLDFKVLRAEMRSEIRELRSETNSRFNAVDAELRYFHGVAGKLEGRIESLKNRGR